MKYEIFPVILGLSFVPNLALGQEGPQLQINGSLKFGWQRTEEKFVESPSYPPDIESGLTVDANLGGLVYGTFDGGLSYGVQFWVPVADSQEDDTSTASNAVRRNAGVAAYIAGSNWQFSAGHMDDAYRAALGNIDVGNTVGDLPVNTLLNLGANDGFLRYTGGPSLRFDVTYSDFTVYSSISNTEFELLTFELERPVIAAGLRWEKETRWGKIFTAAAVQSSDYFSPFLEETIEVNFRGVSAGIEVEGLTVKISQSEGPISYGGGFINAVGLAQVIAEYRGASVEYKFDGWTVGANYGRQRDVSSFDDYVTGEGRGIWLSKQLANDSMISASWSHTHFDDSVIGGEGRIDTDTMSIGFIKNF